MFALLRLVGRRITKNRMGKSVWIRRAVFVVAAGRWLLRILDKPQVIRLRKNETATVVVRQLGSKES